MAENKTKATGKSVGDFLKGVTDPERRADCDELMAIMKSVTREEPKMWGPTMIGFGSYHYKYESGREGDSFLVGFSPRKPAFSIYLLGMVYAPDIIANLGKFKRTKGCLYVKRMSDIDKKVFKELVKNTVVYLKRDPDKNSNTSKVGRCCLELMLRIT